MDLHEVEREAVVKALRFLFETLGQSVANLQGDDLDIIVGLTAVILRDLSPDSTGVQRAVVGGSLKAAYLLGRKKCLPS